MTKAFEIGARVRLTEQFHDAEAGTEFEVLSMVSPNALGGFWGEGVVQVGGLMDQHGRRAQSVPCLNGKNTMGLIHERFLEVVP